MMSAATLKARQTPMAPYIGLLQGMDRSQKLAIMAFLVDSMQETEETLSPAQTREVKGNPFAHFRRASEFTEAERAVILEKMRATPVSSETENLITELSLSGEEMKDERTRYILGRCHRPSAYN